MIPQSGLGRITDFLRDVLLSLKFLYSVADYSSYQEETLKHS